MLAWSTHSAVETCGESNKYKCCCITTVAQRVVAKGNWDLLERNVKVTLVVRGPDPLDELLQSYSPINTIVLRRIPTSTSRRSLLAHIAANTHKEEGEDYEFEERNGTALVVLKAHCECCNIGSVSKLCVCVCCKHVNTEYYIYAHVSCVRVRFASVGGHAGACA